MTTSTNLNTFKIAKGTKAQILAAYDNGTITSTDFAIATDENYVTTDDLATVATSGSYSDLSNKPTIPTVNNATLTIQKNGTTVNTFTANASTNVTANITVPTQASDIGAQDTLISGTNIKTVGGTSLLGSGDVAFPTVDQTYSSSSTSTNALSHKAIADSKFIRNTATGTSSISVDGGNVSNSFAISIGGNGNVGAGGIAIGSGAKASGSYAIAIGTANPEATGQYSIAIGRVSKATANYAIQLGKGENSEANSFYVATSDSNNYKMLGSDGKIPDDRLSTNIAKTSSIPTVDQTYSGSSTNAQSGVAVKSAIDAAISSVYKPGGSVAFASLPTPGSTNEGYVYNVTDAFTTTSSFVEGAGIDYPAGTNVVIVDTGSSIYKFDTLTGAFQPLLVSGTNIKTINNTSLLGSGDITISAPTYTAGSGISITNNEISVTSPTLKNESSTSGSLTIAGTGTSQIQSVNVGTNSSISASYGTAVGYNSTISSNANRSVAIGQNASSTSKFGIAIGSQAHAYARGAIQIGYGTNNTPSTVQIGLAKTDTTGAEASDVVQYTLLTSTGKIPSDRLNVMTGADGTNAGTAGVVPAPTATDNTKFLRGDGTWAAAGGSDVEAYTASEVETIWNSVLPSSFSFIKGSGITDYTINNQTYTSNKSIDLWDGEYTLTVSTSSVETGGLCINDTTLGLTLSCSVIVSGSSITFSNSIYTVSGTSSTNFTLTFSSGGSVN